MIQLKRFDKEIDLNNIIHFNYNNFKITSNAQTLSEIAIANCGIHSARLPSAYVALKSRMKEIKFSDLDNAITTKNQLIKIRCMRKTLHTVDISEAPIYHNATLQQRISTTIKDYKNFGLDQLSGKLEKKVVKELGDNPISKHDLETFISTIILKEYSSYSQRSRLLISRNVIKSLWEKGLIVYLNYAKAWHSEKRYFVKREIFTSVDLNSLDVNEARSRLIYNHINNFGPVTIKDIKWWSGLALRDIEHCFNLYKEDILNIKVNGIEAECFMTLESLKRFEGNTFRKEYLYLLAHEDSALKGYYESRFRYVSKDNYNSLFNQIGESRSCILENGEIIGIWEYSLKQMKIRTTLFKSVKNINMTILKSRIEEMEQYLFQSNQLTLKL